MKFVIRDDDLNYFSKPEEIEKWYADLFAEMVPVGFASIPFVKLESDVYTGGTAFESREYPVSENRALIEYVRAHPQIEILQHGTTHETKNGVFEYGDTGIPCREAARGKAELERAFGGPITIFVPPHDWLGTVGVYAVEAARLNVIRGRGAGLRNFIPRMRYLAIFFYMLSWKLSFLLRGKRIPAYPYVLDFGKHKEACSYRLEDTDVFEGLKYAHKKNGIFVVVTHLHFYTEEKKERLRALIEEARSIGAEFVAPSKLFR